MLSVIFDDKAETVEFSNSFQILMSNSNFGTFNFESRLLGREISFQAIFPENYSNSDEKFPVLYLLHGLFGRFDNWLTNTNILEYAEKKSYIIVCAEGGDGWYSDSSNLENHFYESYILDELIYAVEEKFKVVADRHKRAIAGLSMGGYGAFKFAFRRPEMFCFAAAMSGAFHAAEITVDDVWTELQNSISQVFGSDQLLRNQNNLFRLVESFPAALIAELPYFYFDCGAEDSFLPVNVRLSETFEQRKIAHEFKIYSGGHDWNYWNYRLKNILEIAAEKFIAEEK